MTESRILLISEVFPPQTGGSGRWFWEIYSRLPRESVVVAAGEYPGAESFDAEHDLDLIRMPLRQEQWGLKSRSGLSGYVRNYCRLGKLVKDRKVRMLHAARCLPEGWLAWCLRLRFGIPYAVYVHGEEVEYATSSRELSWMVRRVIGRAEYLIANSRNTRQILEETWQVPRERIRVVHPGVDTTKFRPAATDEDFRARHAWNERRVILTVGRLQRRKGHDTVIGALPQIRESVPDVLYAICGDGEERERLQSLAEEYHVSEHVQFLGEPADEELVRCYQQCDVFVLANRQVDTDIEGFGIVLLEAQACGKPVVAGDSGGTRETMEVPATGRIVDCTTSEPLAAVLTELLEDADLRATMGRAGRARAQSSFDWEALAGQARNLFGINDAHASCQRSEEVVGSIPS